MTTSFKPAVRENVGLLIGLAGASGSGKTYSALELATGLSTKPFAFIDSESRRGLHYADRYRFDHAELNPPFRPMAYAEKILEADRLGYEVIVVDSMSHEHAGDGGLLDWHEEELDRMAGNDWKKRESCNMAAWIKPKMEHKQFVQKLLQIKAHLILCFRAEEKIDIKKEGGRTVIVPKETVTGLDGYVPVCEKNLPYELTASFLLKPDRPGYPNPIKLQQQHRSMFPLDQQIGKRTGELIRAWASGVNSDVAKPKEESAQFKMAKKLFTDATTLEELKKNGNAAKGLDGSERDEAIRIYTLAHEALTKKEATQ